MATIVRCWQSDSAHAAKPASHLRDASDRTLWGVPRGLTVDDDRGHNTAWAVRMVLSCQRARATEAE